MTLDKRIDTVIQPMFGCHSDLDHLKRREAPPCTYRPYYPERACEKCRRLPDKEESNCAECEVTSD